MKDIKQTLLFRKDKIEKNLGLNIAAFIAAVIYGVMMTYGFFTTVVLVFALLNLMVLVFEYKKLGRANKIFARVEERFLKKEITEQEAIDELKNTEV